jgi:hypothetical protein
MRRVGWLILSSACLAAGCGPSAPGPDAGHAALPPEADRVDGMNLLAMPTAITFGQSARPNGVGVRLYLYQDNAGKVVPVSAKGEVRFSMYEGSLRPEDIPTAKPLHTWQLGASELHACLRRDAYGLWCYQIPLPWGADVPKGPAVTLVARYRSLAGAVVASSPTTVSTNIK